MSWTSCSFFARAASRSFSDSVSMFLAAASNSGHFCQTSGLALDLSVSEPAGNSDGMCWELRANVSALTATPSRLPALALACASAQAAPFSFITRWRSATMSPEPVFIFVSLAHPAATATARPRTTRPAPLLDRLIWLSFSGRATGGSGGASGWGMASVPDLVLDRGDRLEVAGDGEKIRLGHVLEPCGAALNDLAHEPAGDVA